jgi:phosphate transport system substrate-binding protein
MIRKLLSGLLILVTGATAQAAVTINGAGASFPAPMYAKFIGEYRKVDSEVRINYSSLGSGAGMKQISDMTVDFGASDAPMSDKQLAEAKGGALHHIPTVMGAVVPIYNVPEVKEPLKFSGPVLAGIFLGKINKWNDAQLAELNPGVALPDKRIVVVHRADGSGTTAIFTEYLTKVSPEWAAGPGKGSSVKWPAPGALAGKGNEQVAAITAQTAGAIGYVELIYARKNKIAYGSVRNKAGKDVTATLESVSAAAGSMKEPAEDLRISITDAEGDASYPISGLTWILIYENQKDAAKAQALVDFLWWVTHDGQKLAAAEDFAPLPAELLPLVEKKLSGITVGGKAITPKR